MKNLFNKILVLGVAGVMMASCGSPKKMAKNANLVSVNSEPETMEVVAGKINEKVTVNFPAKYFNKKAVVEATPVLVYQGGEVAGEPVMLQGEKVTENNTLVSYEGGSVSRSFTFDYVKGMEKSHLELRMKVLFKGKEIPYPEAYKLADGANTTYMMVNQKGTLTYAPDNYQAIIPEQTEAQILYNINSSTVRYSQLKSEQIKAFEDFLAQAKADERRTIKGTEIVAYASPDGTMKFNTSLSEKRAKTANKAFTKTINKKVAVEAPVTSTSISEDWNGFKELVAKSNITDKDLILRVLDMYSDPEVRESEIKNMSQVYTILAKDILPQLRRARFITSIDFKNYTNDELKDLINSNIEILDEEALLHAASIVKDMDVKAKLYKKASNKYNSDRAKVNAAIVALHENNVNAAQSALSSVNNKDAYYYNTVGVIALRKGDCATAKSSFAKSNLDAATCNLAVIDIKEGKYAAALSKYKSVNAKGFNVVLANILNDNLNAALNAANANKKCSATCPNMNYLKAVVYARQGKTDLAKKALEVVKGNKDLAAHAENDIEFAKL